MSNLQGDCNPFEQQVASEKSKQKEKMQAVLLAKHKAVMRRVLSDPASLAAKQASELVRTMNYLKSNNELEWFLGEEGFATLMALTRAVSGSAPLSGLDMNIDLGVHVLAMLTAVLLTGSRESLYLFMQYNLLSELFSLLSTNANNNSQANVKSVARRSKITDQVLELLDNILKISQQRQQIPNCENPEKLDAVALMGPDMRKLILELGFVEWAVANLNSLGILSDNLMMNIMHALVDKENPDKSFNLEVRFLQAGGVAALEKSLKGDVVVIKSGDKTFEAAHALLALRLASGMMLNNAEMAKAFGKSGILDSADAILSTVRMRHFYVNQPIEKDTEHLVICTMDFVSTFIDHLSTGNRDAVLKTDIIDNTVGFLEHAALGKTSPVVSSEFRIVALNVLVSGLNHEDGTQPHSNRAFAQYLLKHDSAIETLMALLERGDTVEVDNKDTACEAQERLQNEATIITGILNRLGEHCRGTEDLITKGVDQKKFDMHFSVKAAAKQVEDPGQQSMASGFDRLELDEQAKPAKPAKPTTRSLTSWTYSLAVAYRRDPWQQDYTKIDPEVAAALRAYNSVSTATANMTELLHALRTQATHFHTVYDYYNSGHKEKEHVRPPHLRFEITRTRYGHQKHSKRSLDHL